MAAVRAPAFFQNVEFNHQLFRTLGATVYGAADVGEVYAIAGKIRDGDAESWWTEWRSFADRLRGIGGYECISTGYFLNILNLVINVMVY